VRVYQFRHIRAEAHCSPATMRGLKRGALLLLVVPAALAVAGPAFAQPRTVELVVTLKAPSLATAAAHSRQLAAMTMTRSRLDLASPSSVSYIQQLEREQTAVAARIRSAIPGAFVHWRYTVTLNGLAVVVPTRAIHALARVPGVARVWPTATFTPSLDRTPQLIGAPAVWGPTLATAGQGMKIGIIDEGVDQSHPFLDPTGFTMPAGFPKGNTTFTTAKVIVARAFAPAKPTWKYANLPFDPENSEHATHVAGIAAGDYGTRATNCPMGCPATVSGIAPKAYIGNYKALTIPTPGFGLDGNAPEIAKAIDQAVADGMDVINLSLGEPEIDPARDIVVQAIDGAADAGVVPVIAAGNDFSDFGQGSVGSPGDAPQAITVAAATTGRGGPADVIADFSSSGPTPYSLQLKPDVTAPGVNVLSSVPARVGMWALFSGTSMATPHVAGAAALLKQQHPTWTVVQVKAALEGTGDPVYSDNGRSTEVTPLREGGGRIDLPRANNPLLFATPSGVSFGLLKPGQSANASVTLTDAGGGAGTWTVTVQSGARIIAPATATVPGTLALSASIPAGTADGDAQGFVLLSRGSDVRRIPFWLHVESPKLGPPTQSLLRTGTFSGNAATGKASVDHYRYPDPGSIAPLPGPEQIFSVKLAAPTGNFGVRVVTQANGVHVMPRIVRNDDENQLVGYTGLPFDFNPYRDLFGRSIPVVAAILPAAGNYDVVFDTASAATAGKFTFRFWLNDVTPPTVKILGYKRGQVRRSSIVGICERSRSTLAANSSSDSSWRITFRFAFRFARSRPRRASLPTQRSRCGHSAAISTPTAQARSAIQTTLTKAILPGDTLRRCAGSCSRRACSRSHFRASHTRASKRSSCTPISRSPSDRTASSRTPS
jgi:subtilisin family serine protease